MTRAGRSIPEIRVALEGLEPLRRRFSASEWKAAIRAALEQGAHAWIGEFLPQRFTAYAAAKLGYGLRSNHRRRKIQYGAPEPLMWTGDTADKVLSEARPRMGGSAASPWAKVPMRLPGPRAKIVGKTLSTIIDDEMALVAQILTAEMARYVAGAAPRGGKSKKLSFAGLGSRIGSADASRAQAAYERREGRRWDAAAAADDRRTGFAEGFAGRQQRVQRRLRATHARWRRQSGGAAPTGYGMSQTHKTRLARRRQRTR